MGYSLSDIAMFFVVGFGSSALVGTRVASLADDQYVVVSLNSELLHYVCAC